MRSFAVQIPQYEGPLDLLLTIVRRNELFRAIGELRSIGGSGVVVLPVKYIFDEEPPRYAALLQSLKGNQS